MTFTNDEKLMEWLNDDLDESNEWEEHEEDGPLNLEDQLDRELDRHFPVAK